MTARHDPATFEAERHAWAAYCASVHVDYQVARSARAFNATGRYVEPSAESRVLGAGWLAAYRERELHCRRGKGA